jgi:hypothetical protein
LHVRQELLERDAKQLRSGVPAQFSRDTLQYVREIACKHEAQQSAQRLDCAKWTPDPPAWHEDLLYGEAPPPGPFSCTSDYVCGRCKHPVFTNAQLIDALGLAQENESFSERTLQRYLKKTNPTRMPVSQLRKAVANAFFYGWLSQMQVISIWQQIDRLEATQSGLRSILQRLSERKKPLTAQELEREFERQMRLIANANDAAIDARLQDETLPPALREYLTEVRDERLREQATKREAKDSIPGDD